MHAAGHVRWISDSGAFEASPVDLAVKCFTAQHRESVQSDGRARMLSPRVREPSVALQLSTVTA